MLGEVYFKKLWLWKTVVIVVCMDGKVYQNAHTILASCIIEKWGKELPQRYSKAGKIPPDATKTAA